MKLNRLSVIGVLLCLPAASLLAQRNRIASRADNTRRVTLHGHVHPLARSQYDHGRVDPALRLRHVSLTLKPSDSQQADLDQLLAEQQDRASPNYHRWLTPEQYADRFGVSQADIQQMTDWLQSQNLTVASVARARNAITFDGTAADVEKAFGTQIDRYQVEGETHFANTSDPTIPAAFQSVVRGIHGLNDFRMRPPRHALQPKYDSTGGAHYLAPDDWATIYNVKSLYGASIDGTGQKLVVVGQTQVNLSDLQQFRSYFNLPANDPQILLVPNTKDPGIVKGDMTEADLDLEWSGAVARNASITYVYSQDVMDATQYAIDQNLAPVLSMSYGQCETLTTSADAATLRSWAKQANAQGMTWFAASGDSGGADCYDPTARSSPTGLAVDIPASIPEVTGVGGTTFNEGAGNYWNSANDANHASALSYIPEVAWNDSLSSGSPAATGGGMSTFFAKPAWQNGAGVPGDSARDVPDVALAGSPAHDGYLVYSAGKLQVIGGTSAGAPSFAGIAALVNHYLLANGMQSTAGLGNVNPRLYALAQTVPAVFHDVTGGDNLVTACSGRVRTCAAGAVGYSAAAGYDQVTGLGSVDAYNLVTSYWDIGANATLPAPAGPPAITSVSNGASFQQSYAPGMVLSVFGSNFTTAVLSAATVPLPPQMAGVSVTIGGVAAPLYYVSPGQLNVQIPYEAGVNPAAVLTVNSNGQSASRSLAIAAAAPGIFTDASRAPVPYASAARGQVVTLYVTGAGAVTPAIATGAAAAAGTSLANLPRPVQAATVTVGGIAAPIQFIGLPSGVVGVTQINYQVPGSVSLGTQSVVVTVGGVSSPPANLLITQ